MLSTATALSGLSVTQDIVNCSSLTPGAGSLGMLPTHVGSVVDCRVVGGSYQWLAFGIFQSYHHKCPCKPLRVPLPGGEAVGLVDRYLGIFLNLGAEPQCPQQPCPWLASVCWTNTNVVSHLADLMLSADFVRLNAPGCKAIAHAHLSHPQPAKTSRFAYLPCSSVLTVFGACVFRIIVP